MGAQDNLYSVFVIWSKILLPLAAIALLSSMFLFSRGAEVSPTIPFSEIAAIAREQRISAPHFAGVTESGATVSIHAGSIRPDPDQPDAFAVEEISIEVRVSEDSQVLITAGIGELDPRSSTARVSGLARLTTSSGYAMETEGLLADLKSGTINSLGPLEVQTPFGELTAGALQVTISPDGTGQRMVFNEGVRLLYRQQP